MFPFNLFQHLAENGSVGGTQDRAWSSMNAGKGGLVPRPAASSGITQPWRCLSNLPMDSGEVVSRTDPLVVWRNRSKAPWHDRECFRSPWGVLNWVLSWAETLFSCAISNFPSVFVCERESKFVFIEMVPDGRSKAEQGMSEFGFITDMVGHFLFILTIVPFWASARLRDQSHSWVDPLLHTLHFSHFAGFDWANAFRKKDLLIRVKSLAVSGLLLVKFVRCF